MSMNLSQVAERPSAEDGDDVGARQRELAICLVEDATYTDRAALVSWARELLEIRARSEPALPKAATAMRMTLRKASIPISKLEAISDAVKAHGWDKDAGLPGWGGGSRG
jgi:hypothetical protein